MDNERIERLRQEKELAARSTQERTELTAELLEGVRRSAKVAYAKWAKKATEQQIRKLSGFEDLMIGKTQFMFARETLGMTLLAEIVNTIPAKLIKPNSRLLPEQEVQRIFVTEWIQHARNDIEAVDGKPLPSNNYVNWGVIKVTPFKPN